MKNNRMNCCTVHFFLRIVVVILRNINTELIMRLSFSRPQRPHTIYVLKSFRDQSGKSTTRRVETLGSEEEIEKKYGCADGLEWAKEYVARMNEEEKLGKEKIKIELSPVERIGTGVQVTYNCGDLLLLPLYNSLVLPGACERIVNGTRAKYNLKEILETLVMLRLLCPCSRLSSYGLGKKRMRRLTCALEDVYRALSLLSTHIDDIQAVVWENSQKVIRRDTRVIYYDYTNYYFEIEYNDPVGTGPRHPNRPEGIRRRGKSKEHRPTPIVQMGLLMDVDGIPLSFIIFPGNLDARPVYLQLSYRIRAHFLICSLAMVILKILNKQLDMPDLSIDQLISTLRAFNFNYVRGAGYIPLFERDDVTDRLQHTVGICVDTQIVETKTMKALYRKLLK